MAFVEDRLAVMREVDMLLYFAICGAAFSQLTPYPTFIDRRAIVAFNHNQQLHNSSRFAASRWL